MTDKKKADPKASPKNAPTPGNVCRHDSSASPAELLDKAPTKAARLLAHLLTGASINRFEAESLGDHCLPSTISALVKRGLTIPRQLEPVPNSWGKPCHAARYHLPASEHDKARKVLALASRRRRAKP